MDLLIPVAVVLLAVALVALALAKRGRSRQAARTAQQYGRSSTYQPTFEDPAARPDAFQGATAAPAPAPGPPPVPHQGAPLGPAAALGSVEGQAREATERMARDLAALLQAKGAGSVSLETTVTSTTSTAPPWATATSHAALADSRPGGTSYTERSISLSEEAAAQIKALALAGRREEALALLRSEAGMGGRGADLMLEMIVEQF